MSRRVSKTAVALLALTLFVQSPAFAVSRDRAANPDSGLSRIVQTIKKFVKNLVPALNDESVVTPKPPTG